MDSHYDPMLMKKESIAMSIIVDPHVGFVTPETTIESVSGKL